MDFFPVEDRVPIESEAPILVSTSMSLEENAPTRRYGRSAISHIMSKVLGCIPEDGKTRVPQVFGHNDLGHSILAREEADKIITAFDELLDLVLHPRQLGRYRKYQESYGLTTMHVCLASLRRMGKSDGPETSSNFVGKELGDVMVFGSPAIFVRETPNPYQRNGKVV